MKRFMTLCLCLVLTLSAVSGMALPVAVSAQETAVQATANSYASGLVAWYEGTQNTRAGENTSSTVWEDLRV
jgi:opacity protein-like surface antigen